MEKKLILVSHGNFCVELKKSVEMIKSQPEMVTLFAAFKPL